MNPRILPTLLALSLALPIAASAAPDANRDAIKQQIAELDTRYQQAVERNDWRTMAEILHPDFVLVLGDGRQFDREQLLASARDEDARYERQAEVEGTQTVRLFGEHTATVTALLELRGERRQDGGKFQRRLWFTDTYVLTDQGWRYAFGQASSPLPD